MPQRPYRCQVPDLGHGQGAPAPFPVAQGQIEQLGCRPVVREMTPRPYRAAHRAVEALGRIGRADRPADRFRKGEERDDLLPAAEHEPGTSGPSLPLRTPPARLPRPPATAASSTRYAPASRGSSARCRSAPSPADRPPRSRVDSGLRGPLRGGVGPLRHLRSSRGQVVGGSGVPAGRDRRVQGGHGLGHLESTVPGRVTGRQCGLDFVEAVSSFFRGAVFRQVSATGLALCFAGRPGRAQLALEPRVIMRTVLPFRRRPRPFQSSGFRAEESVAGTQGHCCCGLA